MIRGCNKTQLLALFCLTEKSTCAILRKNDPVKLSESEKKPEVEEALENSIKLDAQGARRFSLNLSGKRTEQINNF